MPELAISLVHGILAGVVYSATGYLRNRAKVDAALAGDHNLTDREIEELVEATNFDFGQFLETVFQGAVIGVVSWLLTQVGVPITLQGAENILLQTGILAIVRRLYGFATAKLA
jgi:hydrogenase maturation factor